ncbi:hypothetical protein PT974_12270 [Cladobotryum mycophilum]|uniref:Uncharacterized protein n=1 Tax=Cladobotryum mycophilum TaxID=491253 RepID=A0ABR0S8N8_9HYPO
MASEPNQNVLIPLKLDAFIFNKPVFDAEDPSDPTPPQDDVTHKIPLAKIAPINQPNYTFLRLDTNYIQSDVLNPIDLHNSWPSEFNSRFTDLGSDDYKAHKHRQGVYLHWTIPRLYRSGIAAAKKDESSATEGRLARGLRVDDENKDGEKFDPTVPAFPNVPTRWLVIRHIENPGAVLPAVPIPEYAAWVVESDRRWELEKIKPDVDLQVDVSPFISAAQGEKVDLAKQAEVFIGHKEPFDRWEESESKPGGPERIKEFSLLTSSNQLFADYQPHCSNVFSIVDNFEYAPDLYLDKADASYYVIGWHSKDVDDMFCGEKLDHKGAERMSRSERLELLKLAIKLDVEEPDPSKRRNVNKVFENWLTNSKPTHIVCHGAMYNVHWDRNSKPDKVPADDASKQLNGTLPLAVGTTPMDALLTFAHAHQDIDPAETADLEELILMLEAHLISRDDGVETQQQALDMLYNWNYLRVDGGQTWNIAGKESGEPAAGKPGELLDTLRRLNREQLLLDGVTRTQTRLRWELFAEWWRHVTDRDRPSNSREAEDKDQKTKKRVDSLGSRIDALQAAKDNSQSNIDKWSAPNNLQPGARPAFYQQRDPTLLVGGIKSGWQHDYLDTLQVRLDSQIVYDGSENELAWNRFGTYVDKKMPDELQSTIKRLFNEFCVLNPRTSSKEPVLDGVKQMPLFHDDLAGKSLKGPWRDRWQGQPWFPLFLEWEVEYSHIPYDQWKLTEQSSRSRTVSQLRYGIKPDVILEDTPKDERDRHFIEGRALILPQPSFSLEAKIKQLFDSTPSEKLKENDKNKDGKFPDKEERERLQNNLHKLAFLSAPLAGLTAHLTTVLQGSHIKPNLRDGSTGQVKPIQQAERGQAGFDSRQLARINIETDLTPFGTDKKPSTTEEPLFKLATHGQFRFTRLNIIDKFGQAIYAIDPSPTLDPQKVWPCISEWYAPQLLSKSRDPEGRQPNVFEPEKNPPQDEDKKKPRRCEFVQIPPQVNQLSRLNATFVKRDGDVKAPFWRPADEWDNPIWGWVIINYANQGIQIFMPDGSFYREVRIAGPTKAQVTPEWLPFPRPKDSDEHNKEDDWRQLQLLAQKLGDYEFLKDFWEMIVKATGQMMAAPEAYASFSNALIGRPLALAQAGWSLELAADELTSQAEDDDRRPWLLLPDDNKESYQKEYEFPVKMGDRQRAFDGLVGYFPCRRKFTKKDHNEPDLGLKLDCIYSYYLPDEKPAREGDQPSPVKTPEYIPTKAFWASPEKYKTAEAYVWQRNSRLDVYGLLLDPFSPVHCYSGILPVRELTLPPWTWQAAMAKMKAFFHAGPIMVTSDVPSKVVSSHELKEPVILPEVDEIVKPVALPAMGSGDWAWLQPYDQNAKNESEDVLEKFMSMPVKVEDERARFETGPYTALEGYVMMVGRPDDKKT